MGLGLEIFAVDEQHSQLLLSACSDGDTWTLSPVEKFPEACGQRRVARSRPVWAVVAALALVFYVLVRAGTDVPPVVKSTCDEEPPALTKQQLALLEAGGAPPAGCDEKPSPPSSTTTWSEIAPPSVSSAENWAEVEAVAPVPTLAGVDPADYPFTPMDAAAHKAAYALQQRLWSAPKDLSVEERTAFSHKIYRIKQEELGVLVEKLNRLCPDAIDKIYDELDEIDVNIDKIDVCTFRELDNYLNECLAKKPRARPPKGTTANPLDMMQ